MPNDHAIATRQQRRASARHEAGHAVAIWLLRERTTLPCFDSIRLGDTMDNNGVVQGHVDVTGYFDDTLDPVDKVAVCLAGCVAQYWEWEEESDGQAILDLMGDPGGGDGVRRRPRGGPSHPSEPFP